MIKKLLAALGLAGKQSPPGSDPEDLELRAKIDAAVARFEVWRREHALPAVLLEQSGPVKASASGSRVGGPAWLPEGEEWPLDTKGMRLAFLAQLDLSELPELPDFPTKGVLQFFIGTDDVYGCDFAHPRAGDFRVFFREQVDGAGALHENIAMGPPGSPDGPYSPLDRDMLATGIALTGTPLMHKPNLDVWQFERDFADILDDDALADAIYDYANMLDEAEPSGIHHMGGHPTFTQSDYRGAASYSDVDRVLLNLWSQTSDNGGHWSILWGDVGQGQFTIRRADLLERRFDKALYQWDCG